MHATCQPVYFAQAVNQIFSVQFHCIRIGCRTTRVPVVRPACRRASMPFPALTLHGARGRVPVYVLSWYKFHYGLNFCGHLLSVSGKPPYPAYPGYPASPGHILYIRFPRLLVVILLLAMLCYSTSDSTAILACSQHRDFEHVCALCCALRDSRYCILSWKTKFHASIQRVSVKFIELFDKK